MSSNENPNDLFTSAAAPETGSGTSAEPLASRMRPRTLDEFIGQEHILGPGRLLRRAIAADMLGSIILSGPPGTGKTTLARVIANTTKSEFTSLNAVLGGVKDVRAAIETAQQQRDYYGRRTILFVDEVHRWNKAQQDALLPWVENGTVILIGATTENPFFEVNSALVSRSRIFQLTPLTDDDLYAIARQALTDVERGYGAFDIQVDDSALAHLVNVSDGDARSLLNALQLAVETTPDTFPPEGAVRIGLREAEESIQRRALLYDREGDYHYDAISAFIKSLRGSDPDAALYWMARMIRSGEDPKYLFRRMLISASEDIGLADPHALGVVESAAAAFDRVGMPEGQYHLTHAALYLATAPKSNSTLGYFDAVAAVEQEHRREVPRHLRDDSRDGAGFGHGEGYKYPHSYRDHWVAQAYLPGDLAGRVFYHPSDQGYEAGIATEVERRRELQLAEVDEHADDGEMLTFTPPGVGSADRWEARAAGSTALRSAIRDALFEAAAPARYARILVYEPGPPVLLWEALRRAPEGTVVALFEHEEHRRQAVDRLGAGTTPEAHGGATGVGSRDDGRATGADPRPDGGAGSQAHGGAGSQAHGGAGSRADDSHGAGTSDASADPTAPIILTGRPSALQDMSRDSSQLPDQAERPHDAADLAELLDAGFEAVFCDRLLAGVSAETDAAGHTGNARRPKDQFTPGSAATGKSPTGVPHDVDREIASLVDLTMPGGTIVLTEPAPMAGERLSNLLDSSNTPVDIIEALRHAEDKLFARSPEEERARREAHLEAAGARLIDSRTRTIEERRRLPRETVERWLDPQGAQGYPPHLGSEEQRRRIRDAVVGALADAQVTWTRGFDLIVAKKDTES